jgi:putative membrane protein
MRKIMLSTLGFAILCLAASCGDNRGYDSKEHAEDMNEERLEGTRMEDDAGFAVWAADGGMMEVQLGQLAQNNASSQQVKQFAQSMIDDHSRAGEELKSYAASRNIVLPNTLSNEKLRKYEDLSKKTGRDFDKAYMDFMVKDHEEDIEEYREHARETSDPELRSWLESKIPVLEHHLEMARTTRETVK